MPCPSRTAPPAGRASRKPPVHGEPTPTTSSPGSVGTPSSPTGAMAPPPSSSATSSSPPPGRRTPPTSSPRSTSAAPSAPRSVSTRYARWWTGRRYDHQLGRQLLRHRRRRRGVPGRADHLLVNQKPPSTPRSGSTSGSSPSRSARPASRTTRWSAPRAAWCRSASWSSAGPSGPSSTTPTARPGCGPSRPTATSACSGCSSATAHHRGDRRPPGVRRARAAAERRLRGCGSTSSGRACACTCTRTAGPPTTLPVPLPPPSGRPRSVAERRPRSRRAATREASEAAPRRLAAGRWLRRPVRDRDQHLAHHRVRDRDRGGARMGAAAPAGRVPRRPPARQDLRDRRHHPHRAPHPALRRGPTAVESWGCSAGGTTSGCRPGSGTRPTSRRLSSQHLPG